MTDPTEPAGAYYEAIDAGDYDRFADLLASGVVHERPDRTIEGRDALVGFMRDDRPRKDTSHEVEAVYAAERGDGEESGDSAEVAVRGRLLAADGTRLFAFVDVFDVDDDGKIERIRTYTS